MLGTVLWQFLIPIPTWRVTYYSAHSAEVGRLKNIAGVCYFCPLESFSFFLLVIAWCPLAYTPFPICSLSGLRSTFFAKRQIYNTGLANQAFSPGDLNAGRKEREMENELGWFIPTHVRGRSVSSCSLGSWGWLVLILSKIPRCSVYFWLPKWPKSSSHWPESFSIA